MNTTTTRQSTNLSASESVPMRRQTLNGWLLTVTAIILFILAPSLYFWHLYQVRKQADSFIVRAQELMNKNEPHTAAEYLQRYLEIKPNDAAIRVQLAEDYDLSATDLPGKRRAIELYYQALGWCEKNKIPAMRARLGELLLETGQFAAAEKESQTLVEESQSLSETEPKNQEAPSLQAKGMRLHALAIYGQCEQETWKGNDKERRSVGEIIELALKSNPGDKMLYQAITKIYREQPMLLSEEKQSMPTEDRNRKADQFMDELVAAHPNDSEALLMRYAYKIAYRVPGAAADLDRDSKIGENDPRMMLAKADAEQNAAMEAYRKNGRLDDAAPLFDSALNYYREGLALIQTRLDAEKSKDKDPDDRSKAESQATAPRENWREVQQYAYVNIGKIQRTQGADDEAIKTWKTGLEKLPQSAPLNLLLAESLLDIDRPDKAARTNSTKGEEGPIDILENLVKRLDSGIDRDSADEKRELKYRSEVNALRQNVKLLRGRWHFQRGELRAALPILEQVARGEISSPQQTNAIYRAQFLLGQIHLRWAQPDQAAAAFEEAAVLDPQAAAPHFAAAKAWETLGRYDLAEKHLSRALTLQDSAPSRLELAQVLLSREMQKPNGQRQWAEFDAALRGVREAKDQLEPSLAWQADLLEIRSVYVRQPVDTGSEGARGEFLDRLKSLDAKYKDISEFQEALILVYESLQAPEEADRMMAKYAQRNPRAATTYFLQSRLAFSRRQFDRAQSILEEGLLKTPPAEHASLKRRLVELDLAQNRGVQAAERLRSLLKNGDSEKDIAANPEMLKLMWAAACQALDKQDREGAKRWEDELVRAEGPDGIFWRCCRVQRLATTAKNADDPQFAEAERVLADLKKSRPGWSHGFLLEAILLQKNGKLEEAVDAYQNAIQSGNRQLVVYENLIALLKQLGRYDEIERWLASLKDQLPSSPKLSATEISLAAERGQWQEAIETARKMAESQNADPQAAVSLSRLLELDNQGAKAEATLLKAVEADPDNPVLQYQLLAFYVRNGKSSVAQERLKMLEANAHIPAADRLRLLAQGYELVQNPADAKSAWKSLIDLTKDSPEKRTDLAEQLAERDPESAEKLLRQVLRIDSDSSRAKRLLAQILLNRGGQREWNEALNLLSGKHADAAEEHLYRIARAKLYAARGGMDNLKQAREIMEKCVADPNPAKAEDFILLAEILILEGKLDEAQVRFRTAMQLPRVTAPQVEAYVVFLLQSSLPKEGEPARQLKEETEKWVDKLLELAPASPASVLLKSRTMKKYGREAEIQPFVEKWAENQLQIIPKNPKEEIAFLENVGEIYTYVEMNADAERWHRRARENDSTHYRLLALALARQGRYEEAIGLCKDAAGNDTSAQPLFIAACLMLEGNPSKADYERTDAFLGNATETYRDQPEMLNALAALRIKEERMEEAIALLRRVVELSPRDVRAINNLATLLAEQPDKLFEGKELVDKAIALAGPQAGLLDLKGMIFIAEGKPQEALPLFEDACASPQSDPRFCFHWAVAYQRAGNSQKAQETLQRARSLNFEQKILTPADKKMLAELEQSFVGKNPIR